MEWINPLKKIFSTLPKLQLDFLDLENFRNFSCHSLRWWWWRGVSDARPPTTTIPKLQLDILDLENG